MRVGETPTPGRPARYSTTELVAVERAALTLVERGRDAGKPALTEQRLEEIERTDRIGLSNEQEAMVREVVTSRNRIICVVGLAGAGKTTATNAVAQVFAEAGVGVLGAARSGVAAEKLQDETGIPATTLHRLLDEARACGGLPRVAASHAAAPSSSTRLQWSRHEFSAPSSHWWSRRTQRRS